MAGGRWAEPEMSLAWLWRTVRANRIYKVVYGSVRNTDTADNAQRKAIGRKALGVLRIQMKAEVERSEEARISTTDMRRR